MTKLCITRAPGKQTTAGIQNVVRSKLFVMTNTTLLKNNSVELEKTLQFLSDLKVPTIGLNGLIYSGRGASVMAGIQEQDLPELLVPGDLLHPDPWAAPDLVHPHPVLPF